MRKIIASVALLMSAFAVCTAQEMNMSVHSRLDANDNWPLESNSLGNNRVNWGNSGLYVMADGAFSKKLSFDVSLNLLNSSPASLYQNIGGCAESSFLNWADFTYAFDDRWSLSAGKQVLLLGGWEIDAYDHEQHLDICSIDWQLINVYQYGGKVAFSPSEDRLYALQVATSPLMENLADGALLTVNAQTRQIFGNWSEMFSVNYIQTPFEGCPAIGMASLGSMFEGERLSAFADLILKTPITGGSAEDAYADFGALNTSVTASAQYSFLDGGLSVGIKGGYETISSRCPDFFGYSFGWSLDPDGIEGIVPLGISSMKDYVFGGLFVHYFPMDNLRIHAAVGCNNFTKSLSATVGLLYDLSFKVF